MRPVPLTSPLLQGPVEKNKALLDIERILSALESYQFSLDPITKRVIAKQSDGQEYQVSLALKNANFNHFCMSDGSDLDEKQVGELFKKFTKYEAGIDLVQDFKNDELDVTISLAEKVAMRVYTTPSHYPRVNKLLRGEPFEEKEFISGIAIRQLFLQSLLIISFINKNIRDKQTDSGDIDASGFPIKRPLYRKDRKLPVRIFPTVGKLQSRSGIVSAATEKEAFNCKSESEIVIVNSNQGSIASITTFAEEKEVPLIPSALWIKDYDEKEKRYIAEVVYGLAVEVFDNYALDLAIDTAYKILFRAYVNGAHFKRYGINRPNHALAHHLRVVSYLDRVIEYFKNHAKEPAFRDYCENLHHKDIKIIKILLVFSKTGRECEVAFLENKALFLRYQKASVKNLTDFLAEQLRYSSESIAFYAEVLKYMGDPDYRIKAKGTAAQRQEKIYINHIIDLSHKLDLSRCYDQHKYKSNLQVYGEAVGVDSSAYVVVNQSIQQVKALGKLQQLALKSLQLTGNMICYSEYGVDSQDYQQEPFVKCNTNPEACLDACYEAECFVYPANIFQAVKLGDTGTVERILAECKGDDAGLKQLLEKKNDYGQDIIEFSLQHNRVEIVPILQKKKFYILLKEIEGSNENPLLTLLKEYAEKYNTPGSKSMLLVILSNLNRLSNNREKREFVTIFCTLPDRRYFSILCNRVGAVELALELVLYLSSYIKDDVDPKELHVIAYGVVNLINKSRASCTQGSFVIPADEFDQYQVEEFLTKLFMHVKMFGKLETIDKVLSLYQNNDFSYCLDLLPILLKQRLIANNVPAWQYISMPGTLLEIDRLLSRLSQPDCFDIAETLFDMGLVNIRDKYLLERLLEHLSITSLVKIYDKCCDDDWREVLYHLFFDEVKEVAKRLEERLLLSIFDGTYKQNRDDLIDAYNLLFKNYKAVRQCIGDRYLILQLSANISNLRSYLKKKYYLQVVDLLLPLKEGVLRRSLVTCLVDLLKIRVLASNFNGELYRGINKDIFTRQLEKIGRDYTLDIAKHIAENGVGEDQATFSMILQKLQKVDIEQLNNFVQHPILKRVIGDRLNELHLEEIKHEIVTGLEKAIATTSAAAKKIFMSKLGGSLKADEVLLKQAVGFAARISSHRSWALRFKAGPSESYLAGECHFEKARKLLQISDKEWRKILTSRNPPKPYHTFKFFKNLGEISFEVKQEIPCTTYQA